MFDLLKKDIKITNIVFKLLIIIYLLFICGYLVNLPTFAHFNDQETVQTVLTVMEPDTSNQEDIDQEDDKKVNEENPQDGVPEDEGESNLGKDDEMNDKGTHGLQEELNDEEDVAGKKQADDEKEVEIENQDENGGVLSENVDEDNQLNSGSDIDK